MIGTIPYAVGYTKQQFADVLTENENHSHCAVISIVANDRPRSNYCTFVRRPLGSPPLGDLVIISAGAESPGKKLFTTSIFAADRPEADQPESVDVYRLDPE